METSFLELKQKEVVNLCDGKRLGRVCDVVFTYPEGKLQGIVTPGGKGLRFGKGDLFIELKNVKKIGVDVVLVEIRSAPKQEKKKGKWGEYAPPSNNQEPPPYRNMQNNDRRDYGEYE